MDRLFRERELAADQYDSPLNDHMFETEEMPSDGQGSDSPTGNE